MKIGIEQIGFAIPNMYLSMDDLAAARGVDPNKFKIGIGQDEQAVPPLSQDPVTLGVNAALEWFKPEMRDQIGLLIFGTESSIDESKATAMYAKRLLGIHDWCRCFEAKEACYGATAGLMTAYDFIKNHPDQKAIIFGADIARYGLDTPGEVTQGAGGIAMLVSADPKIMEIEPTSTPFCDDVMDFWRPQYFDTAIVNGHYSTEQYLRFFKNAWNRHKETTGLKIEDYVAFCYHLPFMKQGLKALRLILPEASEAQQTLLQKHFDESAAYSRRIGNIYTASIYLSLISLLDHANDLKAGDRIGMFSYGSGAASEFFTGKLLPNYQDYLRPEAHKEIFEQRRRLTVPEYEEQFKQTLPHDASDFDIDVTNDPAPVVLTGLKDKQRIYDRRK